MKKILFTFIIAVLGFSVQAQDGAMAKFSQLCQDCNTGKADYPIAGCRVLDGLCEGLKSDAKVVVQKDANTIKKVTFAYEHSGETMYGITAKVSLVDKKGKVVATADTGEMYVLSDKGNISRVIGTQTQDFMTRQLENTESALFSFSLSKDYRKKDKLKVKVTISKMDKNTRTLVVVKEFEEKVK